MAEGFRLVSDEIRTIARVAAESPDQRGLQQWVTRHGGLGLTDPNLIITNEEVWLGLASGMLQDDRNPFYEVRGRLGKVFNLAIQDTSAYLLYALKTHRGRLLKFMSTFGGDEAALKKKLRNLERGIDNRIERYDKVADELDEIEEMSVSELFLKYATRDQKRKVEMNDGFLEGGALTRFKHDMDALYQRKRTFLDHFYDQIHDMDGQYAHLNYQLNLLRQLQPVLDDFTARLQRLVPEPEVPGVVKSKIPQGDGPNNIVPKRNKRKQKKPVVSEPDEASEDESSFCDFEVSIERLREVIAGAVGGKIAIVLPNDVPAKRDRLLRGWKKLLKELGFSGAVVVIDYTDIGRNGASIILPRKMNVHKDKWTDPHAPVVIIGPSQTLLLNYLRHQ